MLLLHLSNGSPIIVQISCIRLLEVMPVVFERLLINSVIRVQTLDNIKWLHDLADWGKSSLAVVVRYWKQTLVSMLGLIKSSCTDKSASAISDIEKLISCGELLTSGTICFSIFYFISENHCSLDFHCICEYRQSFCG